MTTVNVYLTFEGNCEEAFNFYKDVFGGEFSFIGRFKDMPLQEGSQSMSEHLLEQIMHISLPISEETALFGSDAGGEWAKGLITGRNLSISVSNKDVKEIKRIYNELSAGGKILMPLKKTFWQSWFGMFTDKFGINWMVNCELPEHEEFEKHN